VTFLTTFILKYGGWQHCMERSMPCCPVQTKTQSRFAVFWYDLC